MQVKEFSIERYGPLNDRRFRGLEAFTLFFGKNERGKTLIVDALIKMLFKRRSWRRQRYLGNLLRVQDQPEGHILIEKAGEDRKLGASESVTVFFDEEITWEDFRNIFVVRDSDLEIRDEVEYYTSITERLTGIRTTEIEAIKRQLQEKGNLTSPSSEAKLTDQKDTGNIAAKTSDSRELIEEIEALIGELTSSGFDLLEERLADKQLLISKHQAEIGHMEKAKRRKELEESKSDLLRLKEIRQKLSGLEAIKEDALASWKNAMREKDKKLIEMKRVEGEEKKQEELLKAKEGELEQLESARIEVEAKINKVSSIGPNAVQAKNLKEAISRDAALQPRWRWGFMAALALCVVGLIGYMVDASYVFVSVIVASAVGLGVCFVNMIRFKLKQGEYDSLLEKLFVESKSFHEGDRDLAAISLSMENAQIDFKNVNNRLQTKIRERESIISRMQSRAENKKRILEEISDLEAEIKEIKADTGMRSPEELKAALDVKRSLNEEKHKIEGAVASVFHLEDLDEDGIDDLYSEVDEGIKSLGIDVDYDPRKYENLKEEIEQLKAEIEECKSKLGEGRSKMRAMGFRVKNKEILQDDAGCESIADLRGLAVRLKKYVDDIEVKAEDARTAISIFEELASKEKSRIGDLFGPGQTVSRYFNEITEGSYKSVEFDTDDGKVYVVAENGDSLPADCLSGGTLHQLYFSIRLSIGMKYLKNEKGFLILDDPFIKSDYDRLQRQLAMLKRIAGDGWQILYFSAKREVMELLEGDIASGSVKRVHLEEHV